MNSVPKIWKEERKEKEKIFFLNVSANGFHRTWDKKGDKKAVRDKVKDTKNQHRIIRRTNNPNSDKGTKNKNRTKNNA